MVFDVGGIGDKSFNDSAYNGLTAAAENMGVDEQYARARTPTAPTAAS